MPDGFVINACCYSLDGNYLALGVDIPDQVKYSFFRNTIQLYDTRTFSLALILKEHTENIKSIAFGPDGKKLASGSGDGTINLWDIEKRKWLHTFEGHTKSVNNVAFGPNELLVSESNDLTIRQWHIQSQQCVYTYSFEHHAKEICSIAWSPNGIVALGIDDHTIKLWNFQDQILLEGHTDKIKGLAFSSEETLASGGDDCTIRLWDVKKRKCLHTFYHAGRIESLAFSSNGILLSKSIDGALRLWDVQSQSLLHIFLQISSSLFTFGPNGTFAACKFNVIEIYEGGIFKTQKTLRLSANRHTHTDDILGLAFGEGATLASSSQDCTVRLWDVENRQWLYTSENNEHGPQKILAYSNGILAFSSDNSIIRLWDARNQQLLHIFQEEKSVIESVALGPNGVVALGSKDGTIRLWDIANKKWLHTFESSAGSVKGVAFGPNGMLASTSDEDIELWDIENKKLLHAFKISVDSFTSVAFGLNGVVALGSKDGNIRLWDIENNKWLHTFTGQRSSVKSVAFGPNGILVSTSADNTIQLWDIQTQKCLGILSGIYAAWHETAKGIFLATGDSSDRSVRYWQVSKEDNSLKIRLIWTTTHVLNLQETLIDKVNGLSDEDETFLKKRGAVGNPASAASPTLSPAQMRKSFPFWLSSHELSADASTLIVVKKAECRSNPSPVSAP